MEKIININFSGSAIAIDEQAHDKLKTYLASLNNYFSNEESKDEIISDIESRIGELCANKLKQGKTFIATDDVEEIMNLMGRPADLGAEEEKINSINNNNATSSNTTKRGKLVRNSNDKLVSGVASGIGNYFNIDPAIVRILFILFGINGFGILLYIIFWAVLPANEVLPNNIYRRLYRNSDNKMVAGVASGLATYFKVDIWIPRIVFLSPIILSMFFSNMWGHGIFGNNNFHFFGGNFFGNSFGSMFFLTYFILWIVLPEAKTDIEKKALRGEAMDINSIKNNVKQFGNTIETVGHTIGNNVKRFATNLPKNKSTYSSIGSIIGLIIKGIVLFIIGVVLFSLVMVLFSFLVGGAATLPLRNFILNGWHDNFLFYGAVIGLLILPLISIVLWIIKIFRKTNTNNKRVNTAMGLGITVGFICAGILGASIGNGFKAENDAIATVINLKSGTNDTLFFNTKTLPYNYKDTWFDINALNLINEDSMMIRNADIFFRHTNDSTARIEILKFANGRNETAADKTANNIAYNVMVNNNTVTCDEGFIVTSQQKFKAQEIKINVYLPVGKKIKFDDKMAKLFTIQNNNRSSSWENNNGRRYRNREYFINKNNIYYMTNDDNIRILTPNTNPQANTLNNYKKQKAENQQLNKTQDSLEDLERNIERKQEQNERDLEREKEKIQREKDRIEREKERATDQTYNTNSTKLSMPLVAILTTF